MGTVAGVVGAIVAVFKGIAALKSFGDQLYIAWTKYDIDQINNEAQSKKEEYEAINNAYKSSTSDIERRALLRSLGRLR